MNLPSIIKGWLRFNSTPERSWLQFCQTKDNRYLSSLIKLFNRDLFHYLLTQSDRATAEDCLQNCWLKVMRAAEKSPAIDPVKSWLYTIARNCLIDELRRQNRWQTIEYEEQCATINPLNNETEWQSQLAMLDQALQALSFAQREAFVLQQDGFSLLEIAMITTTNTETVKSRLRYARQHLMTYLERHSE